MPLTALNDYGKHLVRQGIIPPRGWSKVEVAFFLVINENGALVVVHGLRQTVGRGARNTPYKLRPQFDVPYRTKHTNSPSPFFLADNAKYLLGIGTPMTIDSYGKKSGDDPERLMAFHQSSVALHKVLLGQINTPKGAYKL